MAKTPASKRIRSKEERRTAGKTLRVNCPRDAHGKVIIGSDPDRDIVKLIKAQNKGRLENLLPVRHGRMSQSAFAFFRGTAGLQAHDLAGTPHSGIIVQACGDCHLMNFGGFATPERTLAFDINDFDETLPAPFEWDIKRLAASFVVAARWRGFKAADARRITVRMVRAYRESMLERVDAGVLEAWYSRISFEDIKKIAGDDVEAVSRIEALESAAQERTHENVFAKLVSSDGGKVHIFDEPPLIYHPDDRDLSRNVVIKFLEDYRATLPEERQMLYDRYHFVDLALKVVGVGSVGTRCFIALLLADPDDPLFLQIKEARPSVLEPYVPKAVRAARHAGHNGHRVVLGQRLMQAASDIFLGWATGSGGGYEFYVRQLRDMKVAPMIETQSPAIMRSYAKLCGLGLARAHDKAGDAAQIAGYLGKSDAFDEAIGDYAEGYADQVERDYTAFVTAIRTGKLVSDTMPGALETALG
ncbi:DUF2252 domain-containing protein [Polymorphobacter arshaanensis]|uniref:DUF2252 domain-containing protein n=1 Tax=Glacieibacterium arshaanense TaxID=2511025 RepID=A0A4Y9ERW7_9SPHN|nr:DUF2252 domain-containing protein [Polymorphobacter arshaanensis]TFU06202.1 DUF2252 domain-containing protein [Polymorphobacter arshaanensis]